MLCVYNSSLLDFAKTTEVCSVLLKLLLLLTAAAEVDADSFENMISDRSRFNRLCLCAG